MSRYIFAAALICVTFSAHAEDICTTVQVSKLRGLTCENPMWDSSTLEDGSKTVITKRQPLDCGTPSKYKVFDCVRPDGSTYQWDGGENRPTQMLRNND